MEIYRSAMGHGVSQIGDGLEVLAIECSEIETERDPRD